MQFEMKKQGYVAILKSVKIDFNAKAIVKDKERYYIIIKASVLKEDIIIVNIFAPNGGARKYVKHILMDIKGEIDSSTFIVRDFNISLTSMDRSSRWRISKDTVILDDILDQVDLIDILKSISPHRCRIYPFLKCLWNIS